MATLSALAIGTTAIALLQSLVAPALPEIQRGLGTTPGRELGSSAPSRLSFPATSPIIARLGDMFGKRRTLILVLIAVAVATVVAPLVTSLPALVVGRVSSASAAALNALPHACFRACQRASRRPSPRRPPGTSCASRWRR
jgi:MFS family permease